MLATLFSCGNANAAATTYTVNATTDTGAGSGTTGDLRYALTQAETSGNSGSTINIAATGTISLTSSLPAIAQDTTIVGPGAGSIIISGAGQYTIFQITSTTATVAISGVTIANGAAASSSGGILNDGILTVSKSTLLGNSATGSSSEGGGITNYGTLTLTNSTLVGNSAASGGGIFNGQNNTLTVLNSTFSGNSGGAIYNFSSNSASALTVVNSLLTGDSGGECSGTGCPLNGSNGNVVGATAAQAKLLPLGSYGGTTLTVLPQPGSAAICAGTATPPSPLTLPTADQRGFVMNTGCVDAGAVQTNYLTVTTASDSDDGSCTTSTCSLRDAINAANTAGGDIGFSSSLAGSTITLASAPPAITGNVNIVGLGADKLTLSGGNSSTVGAVFAVNSGAQASIYGLKITGGKNTGNGGGISNGGTLTLASSAITSSNAANGGGIENSGTLVLSGSTLSSDGATSDGGGIHSTGTLNITNSTFSGNTASGAGGGGLATSGTAFVTNSTFSANAAGSGSGGGIYNSGSGVLIVNNSAFSGNSASSGGAGIDNGNTANANHNVYFNNLVAGSEADCSGCTSNSNAVVAGSAPLAALGSYGGSTQTMLPVPIATGAICAGSSSLALDANGLALTTDQRGFAFGAASYCASGSVDAGAVQTDYTSAQFTNDTGYSALIGAAVTPTPIVSVTENGQNTGGIPVTLAFTGSGTATGLGPVTTVAGTGATFSSIKVDTAGATDSLGVSLPVGSSGLTASANLEIDGPVALSPGSGALTDAYIGAAYSEQLSATGGKGGYSYSLSSGSTLPAGLALSTSGLLSGTPTTLGNSSFSITVTDKRGNTGAATYTLKVNLDKTSVAVASSTNPSAVDASVTFTATITNTSGGSVPSLGTVAFTSDGVGISGCATKALVVGSSNATATCSIDSLTAAAAANPHSIVAIYSGDSTTYATSTSASFSQTVNKASTAVTVSSTGNFGVNQQVTLTATVSPISPVALGSGTVAFSESGTTISGCGTAAVMASTGKATCTTTFMTAGSHTISAVYSGDANYGQTQNGGVTPLSQTVTKATSTVVVASIDNTTGVSGTASNLNDSVTFTATVTPYSGTTALTPPFTGAAAVSGTVSFTSNGKSICSTSLGIDATGNYSATCTTSTLPAGTDNIVASYSGNSSYSTSTNNLSQTVATAATSTAVASSSGTSAVNQSVTFTASVTPFNDATSLSGSVTFTGLNSTTGVSTTICNAVPVQPSTGVAACVASALTPGAYTITASYGSDSNYNPSSGIVSQSVGKATTSISVAASPNPSTINQQVTLSATVTAPTGSTALNGAVSFTDNGNAIAGCSAIAINPNNPTVTCKTSSLAYGAHSILANYGGDANFTDSSSTAASQTVNAAPTTLAITSSASGNTSTVDQAVSFTATVSGASGSVQFSGAMTFTDNGTAIPGCSSISVGAATGAAVCTASAIASGSHTIAAAYSGDTNFSTSGGSLTLKVNPGASSTTLVSSLNPSIALNPNNYQDTVMLTASVSPSAGVPLSGAVTFTDNGAPIAECQSAVPVNPATGTASCATSSLLSGSHTILAVYNGDQNFISSSGTATQAVQDYILQASPTSTVTVSQRFTNTTDVFSPQPVTVAATPISGFTGQLSLSCSVVPLSAAEGAVPPACTLANSSMAISAGGQQPPIAVTIDAGTGSTPVATAGTYNVSITGVDETTGLTHATAAFVVNVRYQAPPLTMVSGATTGNSTTVGFSLPPNVGLSDIICASVTGPTLTSSVAPVALSMGCTFSPSTVPPTSTGQDVVVTVSVSTGAATTARVDNTRTSVALAGLFGVPILMLFGFLPGPKSRKLFFRYLGIVIAVALLFTGTGCGGGSFTAPPSVSGQTPPGSYNILVQGTGTDKQTYQAVIQVNVTR